MPGFDLDAASTAMRLLLAECGTGVLTNRQRFQAAVADYLPTLLRERNVLRQAISANMGTLLAKAADKSELDRAIAMGLVERMLVDDFGLTTDAAKFSVHVMTIALNWHIDAAPERQEPASKTQSLPTGPEKLGSTELNSRESTWVPEPTNLENSSPSVNPVQNRLDNMQSKHDSPATSIDSRPATSQLTTKDMDSIAFHVADEGYAIHDVEDLIRKVKLYLADPWGERQGTFSEFVAKLQLSEIHTLEDASRHYYSPYRDPVSQELIGPPHAIGWDPNQAWRLHGAYSTPEVDSFIDRLRITLASQPTWAAPVWASLEQETYPLGDFRWRILRREKRRILLLSDRIVDLRAYCKDFEHMSIVDACWQHSPLRAWLNRDFVESLGRDGHRILTTKVTSTQPYSLENSPLITKDRVWLLNLSEARSWFVNDADRVALDVDGYPCRWWLRESPPCLCGDFVMANGMVKPANTFDLDPSIRSGVRPALWMSL